MGGSARGRTIEIEEMCDREEFELRPSVHVPLDVDFHRHRKGPGVNESGGVVRSGGGGDEAPVVK